MPEQQLIVSEGSDVTVGCAALADSLREFFPATWDVEVYVNEAGATVIETTFAMQDGILFMADTDKGLPRVKLKESIPESSDMANGLRTYLAEHFNVSPDVLDIEETRDGGRIFTVTRRG